MNRVQFQTGLSMPTFFDLYGTEAQCEAAVIAARWPHGFVCPHCAGTSHCVLRIRQRPTFQSDHAPQGGQRIKSGKVAQKLAQKEKQPKRRSS
jgi:hypothetical protein